MTPPPIRWATATRPKPGNRPDENEDAAAADGPRFAVADGASEGWQSGEWAARLAAAFVAAPPAPADFAAWLRAARTGWNPPAVAEVPWYAEAKRAEGSFATLLGVEFRPSLKTAGWAWRAVAVGDSCVVRLSGGKVVESFPFGAADRFGNQPSLVPSSADRPCPNPAWLSGRADPGDAFVLATDAAAASLLSGTDPAWAVLSAADPPDADRLSELLARLSPAPPDDLTVIHLVLPGRSETLR